MTLEQALERARRRAPVILAARERIDEARGRLTGATILFRDNPELEFSGGPRRSASIDTTDAEFGISQRFELGGRRRSRIAIARADVDRETAASQNTARELLRDVSAAFWRTVAAQERLAVSVAASDVANQLQRMVERRYEVGDVPVLELNIARNSAARARSELRLAEAQLAATVAELQVLVGADPGENIVAHGDLNEKQPYQLRALIAEAQNRPDLRAIAAELRQAQGEIDLGKGLAWPDFRLGFTHGRDENALVTKGGLTLTLPFFSRGQELRGVGKARTRRLGQELEASRKAVEIVVRSGFEVYERERNAAQELAAVVKGLDENETLGRRSYEEGEISVFELLQVRRELFETRSQYINRQLDSALAAVDLEARAGVLR
jgi:cobalt-zinc-cadmium efflux system outer membrane protein